MIKQKFSTLFRENFLRTRNMYRRNFIFACRPILSMTLCNRSQFLHVDLLAGSKARFNSRARAKQSELKVASYTGHWRAN